MDICKMYALKFHEVYSTLLSTCKSFTLVASSEGIFCFVYYFLFLCTPVLFIQINSLKLWLLLYINHCSFHNTCYVHNRRQPLPQWDLSYGMSVVQCTVMSVLHIILSCAVIYCTMDLRLLHYYYYNTT